MNVIQEIKRINEEELKRGIVGGNSGSWHQQYRSSSYVFVGGLPYEMTEGDVLCVFSQFGEIDDITLTRDEETGKSKGFAFIKYEDQRSTILAVDNLNGTTIIGRLIRVDHVLNYRLPKELRDKEENDEEVDGHYGDNANNGPKLVPGHAYKDKELASSYDINKGVDLYAIPGDSGESSSSSDENGLNHESSGFDVKKKRKRSKEEKEAKKMKKKSKEEKKHKKEKREKKSLKKAMKEKVSDDLLDISTDDVSSISRAQDFHSSSDKLWSSDDIPAPLPNPSTGADDSWRGRLSTTAGGKGGKGQVSGQHVGGYGAVSGKGAKLMGPKFGGGGKGKGGDASFGGMGRLR